MTTDHEPAIEVEVRNHIAVVWLNRPARHNAFDATMISDLRELLSEVESEAALRALVLGGRGDAFCAGGDVAWMQRMGQAGPDENLASAAAITELFYALYTCSKPTVARIHGGCFGGGVGLAAACDIAVASTDAEFGCAEVKRGLIPAGIGPYVLRAMGPRAAQRYLLTGERFDAAEAYRLGLVHEICPPAELDGTINALLGHVVAGGPAAQQHTKALLRALSTAALDEALVRQSAQRLAEIRASAEAQEGLGAFLEQRDPAWIPPLEAAETLTSGSGAPEPS